MKRILEAIVCAFFKMLPLIIIILSLVYMCNYRTVVQVNSSNIEEIKDVFEKNNLGNYINENVKEIAKVSSVGHGLAYDRFEVVYANNEVKVIEIEVWEENNLSQYIFDNSKSIGDLLPIAFLISLAISIYLIYDSRKTN